MRYLFLLLLMCSCASSPQTESALTHTLACHSKGEAIIKSLTTCEGRRSQLQTLITTDPDCIATLGDAGLGDDTCAD